VSQDWGSERLDSDVTALVGGFGTLELSVYVFRKHGLCGIDKSARSADLAAENAGC